MKDILVKRNWHWSTRCVFCSHDEIIIHLFFECKVARSMWSAIHIASNLYPPRSVANIFGNWLHGVDRKFRTIIRVGAVAVIWSLWFCRNDKVFNDKNCSLMQVLYRLTSFFKSILQRVEYRDLYTDACAWLDRTASDIFIQHGWPLDLKIGPP